MLSDTVNEKSRNPLKKAMRRRHAKTVVFTDPIYHEASEYEYSSEEEEEGEGEGVEGEYEEEGGNVEIQRETAAESGANGTTAQKDTVVSPIVKKAPVNILTPPTDPRTSSESSGSSRKGSEDSIKLRPNPTPVALRHPDSAIFRDEGQGGTKKLTLTPNLLRDDDVSSPVTKTERGSLDREQKREEGVLSPPPAKGGRLRKGSVLGNFFKKRNKKGRKDEEDEVEEWLHSATEKKSLDSTRSTPMESPNGRAEETRKQKEEAQLMEAQRKLQETQRQQQQQPQQQQPQQQQQQQRPRESEQTEREAQQRRAQAQAQQSSAAAAVTSSTIRRVESTDSQASSRYQEPSPVEPRKPEPHVEPRQPEPQRGLNVQAPAQTRPRSPAGIVAPINTNVGGMKPHPQQRKLTDERPVYSPRTYQPVQPRPQDFQQQQQQQQQERTVERLSESPEQITFHDATERPDTSSGDDTSSLEMIDRSSTFETTTTSPGTVEEDRTITRTWSDWSLRTYFEDDNDVRDMLIVVQQDKGEAVPQKQHPEIAPLFADSSRRLEDITKVCAFPKMRDGLC
jgi:hypothetical protein